MSKIEARPGCTRTKGCISARETNKNEKGISYKLEQGLKFTVNVGFWFYSDDFYKNPEGKKTWFLSFFYDFLFLCEFKRWYFAKRDDLFAFIEYPIFEGRCTQWSQLIVKAMFARLRMFLKQCSLVQPCTAGFGWHGRQWVKQNMYVMKVEKRLFLTVA